MLNRLRTNRSVTGFFAAVLFVASVHPFVVPACLMANAHDRPLPTPCHCEQEPGGHEGMAGMTIEPCENQDAPPVEDHGKLPPDHCCSLACGVFNADPATPSDATAHEQISLVRVILPQGLIETYPPVQARLFKDLSPPPISSLSLFILFARLLN